MDDKGKKILMIYHSYLRISKLAGQPLIALDRIAEQLSDEEVEQLSDISVEIEKVIR